MAVLLKDIAARVGVSDTTISMALRDHSRISPARRAQIKRVAEEMGYVPNPLARGLRGQQTMSVAVLWSFGGAAAHTQFIRDLARRIQRHGYVPYVADHMSDPQLLTTLLDQLTLRRVDAVVVQANGSLCAHKPVLQRLERFDAVLMVTDHAVPHPRFDTLVHDRRQACYDIGRHFAASGRARPWAMVGEASASGSANEAKLKAFYEGVRAGGLRLDGRPDLYSGTVGSRCAADYWQSLAALGSAHPRPLFDAIWCGTDEGAVAACSWLRQHGFRVPDDVAVVGFNDRDDLAFLDPPLASVDRRDKDVDEGVEALLMSRLRTPDLPTQVRELKMRFVWRASAGSPSPDRT